MGSTLALGVRRTRWHVLCSGLVSRTTWAPRGACLLPDSPAGRDSCCRSRELCSGACNLSGLSLAEAEGLLLLFFCYLSHPLLKSFCLSFLSNSLASSALLSLHFLPTNFPGSAFNPDLCCYHTALSHSCVLYPPLCLDCKLFRVRHHVFVLGLKHKLGSQGHKDLHMTLTIFPKSVFQAQLPCLPRHPLSLLFNPTSYC